MKDGGEGSKKKKTKKKVNRKDWRKAEIFQINRREEMKRQEI